MATGMYVRIKHHKSTYFIQCQTSETISILKKKFNSALISKSREVKDIRLQIAGKTPGTYILLDENAAIESLPIQEDDIIYAIFLVNTENAPDGVWEQANIPPYEGFEDSAVAAATSSSSHFDGGSDQQMSTNKGKAIA